MGLVAGFGMAAWVALDRGLPAQLALALLIQDFCYRLGPIPDILAAGSAVVDPDARVIAMIGRAFGIVRGNAVAKKGRSLTEK